MSRAPLKGRDFYRVWRDITTRWSDNDVYGHVNNTIYYGWFDTAVNAWLIEQGLLDIEGGDPIGLVVETGCRYARSLSYPEPIEVGLAVEKLGASSVTYRVGIFAKGSDEPAAEGHFVHVYVGRQSRRPADLPAAWRTRLQAIAAPVEEAAPNPAPPTTPAPASVTQDVEDRSSGRRLRLRPDPILGDRRD